MRFFLNRDVGEQVSKICSERRLSSLSPRPGAISRIGLSGRAESDPDVRVVCAVFPHFGISSWAECIVGPETWLVSLLSESGYQAECEALQEIKSLGATTLVVTNRANRAVLAASDLVMELRLDVSKNARLAPYLFVGQLLGRHTGLKKGLDPDSPRNLGRVVLLDDDKSPAKPEHASIDVTITTERNLDPTLYGRPEELQPERELITDGMMHLAFIFLARRPAPPVLPNKAA